MSTMSLVRCPVSKPCHHKLYTSQSQSVESRRKAQVSSQCSSSLSTPSQSSPWIRGTKTIVSHESLSNVMSCQVRHQTNATNSLQFIGRAEQLCQGGPHGGCQAEGRHVYLATRGEGGVTPAHTPSHAVHVKLCRHVDVAVQHLHLQEHQDEGGASLVGSYYEFATLHYISTMCCTAAICLPFH